MRKRVNRLFGMSLMLFFLSSCGATREYTEYNYSEINGAIGEISIAITMIGDYKDISGRKRRTIKANPYYLHIAARDADYATHSMRLVSARIANSSNEKVIDLPGSSQTTSFGTSVGHVIDSWYAGAVVNGVVLDQEDYEVTIELEFCDEAHCVTGSMSGLLKLEIETYKSNDIIDAIMGI